MLIDRFEADYLLETPVAPERAAEIIAGEQSSGTFSRGSGRDARAQRAVGCPRDPARRP